MKYLSMNKAKLFYIYAAAIVFLIISALLGMLLGASGIGLPEFVSSMRNGSYDTPDARIFIYVRLPRVTASIICGAALAVSGAVIQGVLANRLASSGMIGVNAGAGLAVTLCSAFGIVGGWNLSSAAFIGAFAAVMIVSFAAKKWGASRGTVILIGVAMNSLLGAVSDTVITFIPEVSIMSNDFRIGDFSSVTYAKLVPAFFLIIASLFVLFTLSNELDVLTLGDETAQGLGINTNAMRVIFMMLAACLSGAAVSLCGLLSFVGLLVPHAVRRTAGCNSAHLLPLCALFGSGFVTLSDTISRTVFAPYEIPVGIIMSFLGAPFFIFILLKGGHSRD